MYGGLTYGAAEVIEVFGTHEQKAFYCERMFGGKWGGTMCPHRVAGGLGRRLGAHQGDPARRRQLQDPGHQDLHLRRRSRPRR